MAWVWINGSFVDEASASISIRDTGLLHGMGVFTTMRAKASTVIRLEQHLKRLRLSCEELSIPLLYEDDELRNIVSELLEKNQLVDSRLRLTVTRGTTIHDPVHGLQAHPTVFLTAVPFEAYPQTYYEKGMTVIVLDQYKLNPYDPTAGHKVLDYVARLSALRDASKRGASEALWFNVHNYLQSGSISNVFLVKDRNLLTPPTNAELQDPLIKSQTVYPRSNVLPGTTRSVILDQARQIGLEVRIKSISIHELLEADEVFLTNSVMGVMPVTCVERKPIGDEKPGPVTRQLAERVEQTA